MPSVPRTQLASSAVMDSHDLGSSEFNVFVLTDDRTASFRPLPEFASSRPVLQAKGAACRQMDSDEFVPLWFPHTMRFRVVEPRMRRNVTSSRPC
jgi:hypothetical protein